MFDLDTAISAWRRSLENDRTFDTGDIDELERHLRDHVDALVRTGVSTQDAYQRALEDVGSYSTVESEYRKVFWGKRRRRGELFEEAALRGSMLRNYVRVTWRSMKRQRALNGLNVLGLAVGMAGCLLLTSYLLDELRYDSFHEQSDRIFRVTTEEVSAGRPMYAHTFPAAGPALAQEMPEIVNAARLLRQGFGNHNVLEVDGRSVKDPEFLYVDSTFFSVFTVRFVAGSHAGALTRPNTAVISRDAAWRYFGTESAIGHVVSFTDLAPESPAREFEIIGVVEGFPPHSHVHFDLLLSLETWNQGRTAGYFDNNWRVLSSYTYLRLQSKEAAASLREKLPAFIESRTGEAIPEAFRVELGLQRLTDIHLHSHLREELEANGDIRSLYILGGLAAFLLLIAGINFINLATARASRRAEEVGIRKAMGAYRGQLVRQFLAESMLMAGIAMIVALAIFMLCLPLFNSLSGKALSPDILFSDWKAVLSVPAIFLMIGLAAGSYPALLLSGFRPALVLKPGTVEQRSRGLVRKGLVVTQFALSIALMIATAVMYEQLSYMQNARLGYEKDHLLVLDYRFREEDTSRAEVLRQELLRHPGIQRVAFGSVWPTRPAYFTLQVRPEATPSAAEITTAWYNVDDRYTDVLGLEIIKGRAFSDRLAADSSALIVNEAAVRHFGWTDPLGKQLFLADDDMPIGNVVGVVRDFNYRSLIHPVEPVVLSHGWWRGRHPILKISGHDRDETLAHISETWDRLLSDQTLDYTFVDQAYAALYQAEERLSRTSGVFTLLALTIACLGLFGLAAFTVQQRTKEIGVRKVLGATAASIAGLLAMQFGRLVILAFAFAVPIAYLATKRWLENFAFRIELEPVLFLVAGCAALTAALLTVSYQALKAANSDPVTSLRYE